MGKDLQERAKQDNIKKKSALSACVIHFNSLKSGPNQTLHFFSTNLNLQGPNWVGLIEKITQIVFF
jgi:hypothetical protein